MTALHICFLQKYVQVIMQDNILVSVDAITIILSLCDISHFYTIYVFEIPLSYPEINLGSMTSPNHITLIHLTSSANLPLMHSVKLHPVW